MDKIENRTTPKYPRNIIVKYPPSLELNIPKKTTMYTSGENNSDVIKIAILVDLILLFMLPLYTKVRLRWVLNKYC